MRERIFRRGHDHDATTHDSGTPQSKFKPEVRPRAGDASAGVIVPCTRCKEPLYVKELEANLHVCPKCGAHFRLGARQRVAYTLDDETFTEWDAGVHATDPLRFSAAGSVYQDKLAASMAKTTEHESLVTGRGAINGQPVAIAIADFTFMGATMGSVFGEKLARAAERAVDERLPLVTFNASGGARMQEGLFALMQMAKTTAAVSRLGAAGLPHIAILTDPCYGGVTASYATVADVILAEPGALIGFGGKNIIEQIMKQRLAADVQTAEFQLKHGMIDEVVHRRDLRQTLTTLLALYHDGRRSAEPIHAPTLPPIGVRESVFA